MASKSASFERPNVTIKEPREMIWNLYGIKAQNIKELDSHHDRNFYVEDSR